MTIPDALAAPWRQPELVVLAEAMDHSHRSLLGGELASLAHAEPLAIAEHLYLADFALLCHDGAPDPVFIYANLTAQRLFHLSWEDFVGMPSRLSAEPDARAVRSAMLARVDQDGYVADYSGVRVDSRGQRFRIEDASIWNVQHCGVRLGQAARIGRWSRVD